MKGSECRLVEYMEGAKKRFVIPVYQRNYDWKTENCKQLYDDLIKLIRNHRRSHFFGSLVSVYNPDGRNTEFLVIDGQQRLTTVSLLLLAMYNLMDKGILTADTQSLKQQIYEDYLVDKWQPQETRIKLKTVQNDRDAFQRLFDNESTPVADSNLTINYQYFYNRIQKEELTLDQLFGAICSLEIINITLNGDDNPQLIFESLNSTGVALSEGDKIRNFILMGLSSDLQTRYYEKYWNEIEKYTDYDVSLFVRDYLSVKQQAIPSMSRVYSTFKNYVDEEKLETEPLLKDLLSYAKLYGILLHGKTEDRALNACIYRLNRLETTVTRPFFLEVLRLHAEQQLSIADIREVFLLTENYLFRRTICDLPTNALNKIFLMLHREIIRYDGSATDYLEKFKYSLLSKTERGRYPRDDEFVADFSARPIYQMNVKNKIYILERFENYGTVEDKDIYRHCDEGTYSIEHIMPRHLTPAWVEALGQDYESIHDTWLHRLANLTLTGYNSNYSNSSFADKRDMPNGFAQSGLRLNTWIARQSQWTLAEIEKHNEMLMRRAVEIWALPETDFQPAERQLDAYTLEDDVDLSGRDIIRFAYMNTEQPVTSWIIMLEQVLKILHAEDKSVLSMLAHAHDPDNELNAYVSNRPDTLRGALRIDQDIYVERNTSTATKINLLRKFFKLYNANPEDLVLYLKDADHENAPDESGTRYELRRKYWNFALEYIYAAHGVNGSFSNVHASKMNWISGYFGISSFYITCIANFDQARVELGLGKIEKEKNKAAYDYLYQYKESIEAKLGTALIWNRSDETKASYIYCRLDGVSIANETDWIQMAKFHAEWSKKFYDVFVPLLKQWNG